MFLDNNNMTKELIKQLQNNNVRISRKGYICLNDFVINIAQSKNPEQYMKKIDCKKIIINDKYYVKENDFMDILEHGKSKKCKEILYEINKDENDHSSMINPEKNIFQFDGHKFLAFFIEDENGDEYDWQVWVKGSDVAKYLGYVNPEKGMKDNVEDENKKNYVELLETFGPVIYDGRKNIDKKTIFINLSGFFNLIHASKKPLAKKIKSWLDNEVLPALVKHGSYTMQPKEINIELFYDNNAISNFYNKAVIYIAYIGKVKGEYMFKYGLSRNVFRRDYKEHAKHFKRFDVVFIGETDNCELIEDLFEKDLISYKLHRQHVIKGNKADTELFTISHKHSIEDIIEHVEALITKHKLPAIVNAENKIYNLTNALDTYRQSEELRKLELEFKQSDNYRLELEMYAQRKKLDIEEKKVEIQLQREINKQFMIQLGYNIKYYKKNLDSKPSIDSESVSDFEIEISEELEEKPSKSSKRNKCHIITL